MRLRWCSRQVSICASDGAGGACGPVFCPARTGPWPRGSRAQPAHEIDLSAPCILEPGTVTIVELDEHLALPPGLSAAANPKSSTGRIDVFTRVITDRARRFDQIEPGYQGPLFAEISPRTFPVRVRAGSRLAQIRFSNGQARLDDAGHRALHARDLLVTGPAPTIAEGVAISVDLAGFGDMGLVGYRAKRHTGIIDVDAVAAYEMRDYWEPISAFGRRELILDPGEFYLLASKEAVRVPPDHAAEMTPFDPLVGEFRVHYAGFFDPGFGAAEAGGAGSRAVLEVRSRDVPFVLEDGQIVGRLVYERMSEVPAHALWRRRRLELPGAGPQAVEAFPQALRAAVATLTADVAITRSAPRACRRAHSAPRTHSRAAPRRRSRPPAR